MSETHAATSPGAVSPATRIHPLRDAAAVALLLITVALASTSVLYERSLELYRTEVREGLVREAQAAAALVDGDLHRTFVRPEQESEEAYCNAVTPLRQVLQGVDGLRYVYTVILVDETVYFVLDASPPGDADGDGVEDHSHIMEVYPDANEEMRTALREAHPTVDSSPSVDRWGPLMSGYAPFFDSRGQQVGIVGVDISGADYTARLVAIRRAALCALIPAVTASLLAAAGTGWLRRGARLAAALRHQTEEALEHERQQLLSIFENIDEPVYVSDPRTYELLYVNHAFRRLLGDGVGQKCHAVVQGLSEPCSFCTNERLFAATGGGGHTWEFQNLRTGRWFRCMDKAIRWPDGRWVRYEMAIDVTDHKQTEASLSESESRYRLLAECASDMIARIDTDGMWLYVSPACRTLLGYEPAELLGHSLFELIEEPDRAAVRSALTRIQCTPVAHTFVCQVRHRDKSHLWMETTAQARHDPDSGRVFEIISVSRNVTDRKRTEQELHIKAMALASANMELEAQKQSLEAQQQDLEAINQELERARRSAEIANQAKSAFLANMSHEIRTPMTAILGFAEQLLEETLSDLERREAVHTIRRNGQHLLNIINDVLDLSKIEAGKLEVEHLRCRPMEIVRDVQALMQARAAAKGLRLEIEQRSELPEYVITDPTRLRQVLINLVGNALKFTEIGAVRIEASVSGPGPDPLLQFDVADSGIGIPVAQIAKLFRPFSQADSSTNRRFGGTGLGLAISRHFAQKLGGDLVLVSSAPGEGTRFRVTIPITSPTGVDASEASAPAASAVTTAVTQNVRLSGQVLLAEDGPDNQRLISFTLQRWGATVATANNGKIAVELAMAAWQRGEPYDLIVMDVQMPVMDGIEAVRLLRANGYTAPIIALTANAMAEDRQACLAAGCDDYASKPINRPALLQTLMRYLKKSPVPGPSNN